MSFFIDLGYIPIGTIARNAHPVRAGPLRPGLAGFG